MHPAWSPDGATLAFVTDRGDGSIVGTDFEHLRYAPLRLALADVATGAVRVLPGLGEATHVNESQAPGTERSMFDGIDTTWARFKTPSLAAWRRDQIDSIVAQIARARATPYLRDPGSVVDPLVAIVRSIERNRTERPAGRLQASPSSVQPASDAPDLDQALDVLRGRAYRALTVATGVAVEAQVNRASVAAGDTASLTVTVYNRGRRPVFVAPVFLPTKCEPDQVSGPLMSETRRLLPDSAAVWRGCVGMGDGGVSVDGIRLPLVADGPYWLRTARTGDMFATASLVRSEAQATQGEVARVAVDMTDAPHATDFVIETPIVYRYADPIRGDVSRPLASVPEISVTLDRAIEYAPARTPLVRQFRVELRSAATASRDVRVTLKLPAGLRADSAARTVTLPAYGAVRSATFTLRGELPPGRHTVAVVAESNGKRFTSGYTAIEYDHIRPQRLYRAAAVAIESVDLKVPPDAVVAYIQGVGDNSAAMLQQLGLRVTVLNPADIPKTDLSRYNAIVVGTRAYESNDALIANNAALLEYVKQGGTMVVQYGQNEMQNRGMMPYPITLSRPADRVTDEASPVRLLDPKARVLTYPNAITEKDFAGWIQDRALYMPRTHAPEYVGVLSTNDPGEPPNDGGILVAKYGSGTYVYTTLAFFRQLPNGVPGAARLFVNLLAARAPEKSAVP